MGAARPPENRSKWCKNGSRSAPSSGLPRTASLTSGRSADINHIREHIETLEEASRAARAVEFDQIRAVVEQLEAVAVAAKAVERDLSQELATTNRLSVTTARLIRDQLAATLRALAEALVVQERG
jgi:hypothetical protein